MHKADGRVVRVELLVVAEMPGEGIDQRAAVVAAAGMHHEARRFVDDEQGLILVDNIEGDVLWDDFPVALRVVQDERDDVAGLYLVVALDGLVAGMDCTRLGCLLYAVAAGAGHVVHQELIDADGRLPLVHLNAPMLVALRLPLALPGQDVRQQFQELIVQQFVVFHLVTF